jgi:small subunit ribosomal protein S1
VEPPETPPTQLADLKPKMQLEGKVTKIEMFGAFVDVGVGVPGLVHISMLRQGHVNRVEDAVQEGQSVEVWVHRVEPASGRLELTMIRPLLVDWRELKPGLRLKGKVVRLEKFGAFVDIGAEKPGLVHVSEMTSGYVSNPADVVKVGDEIDVTVLDIDRKKRQIRLSMKVVEVEVVEDQEAESEAPLPTAMEVALRQAMEKSEAGDSRGAIAGTGGRRNRKTQEDIISRTLQTRARSTSSE